MFICAGILVAYIVGLPYDANQPFAVSLFGRCVAWWRVIFGLGVVPALLQARSAHAAAPQLHRYKCRCRHASAVTAQGVRSRAEFRVQG